MKKIIDKVKKEKKVLQNEIRATILKYITAGFGVVVGLAWRDVINDLIAFLFKSEKNNFLAKIVYTLAITMILVFVSIYLTRLLKKKKKAGDN